MNPGVPIKETTSWMVYKGHSIPHSSLRSSKLTLIWGDKMWEPLVSPMFSAPCPATGAGSPRRARAHNAFLGIPGISEVQLANQRVACNRGEGYPLASTCLNRRELPLIHVITWPWRLDTNDQPRFVHITCDGMSRAGPAVPFAVRPSRLEQGAETT